MEKKFSVKKYLLFLAMAGMLCGIVFFSVNKMRERENGKNLELLLSELTYLTEEGEKELAVMEKFAPALENMSQRSQAKYYHAVAKLQMLRGDADNALLRFVDAEIHAEIARAYDVAAWIYADSAQVYADLDADSIALECVETALDYGKEQPMENFFYEYCYLLKAEFESNLGKAEEAWQSCEKSLEYLGEEERSEYHSMEQRQNLVKASLLQRQGDMNGAESYLQEVEDYMDGLDYPPTDALWFSSVYYPYLTLRTKICLERGDYSQAAEYFDETFATGFIYGQVSSLMSFFNDVMEFMEHIESDKAVADLQERLGNNIQKLIREYPEAFQQKNTIAATYIFNANMITIAVFVQRYRTRQLYARIAGGVAVVLLIIVALLIIIRRTEHKGRIDGLTGAYIRRYFNQVYDGLKNSDKEFGVIMYDIDFFKHINDGFGHDAGDWALRATAHTVMDLLDRDSGLFRFGGDEFCIICQKKSLEEMAQLAEKIRSSVEKMEWHEGMKVSFSMGVAVASQSPDRDVMAKADEKLYASKEAGRNHVSW